MGGFRIPLGEWAEAGVAWIRDTLGWLLSGVSAIVGWFVDTLANGLLSLPIVVVIALFAALAWLLRSWRFALVTVIGFVLILGVGQWVTSMQTLALVLVAAIIAVVIAVPLGIAAARNDTFSAVLRPVLDLMQSMPAFVYLIPAIVFFSIGVVPGVVATVIFALPPGVRLTELGIRGVDSETVESCVSGPAPLIEAAISIVPHRAAAASNSRSSRCFGPSLSIHSCSASTMILRITNRR